MDGMQLKLAALWFAVALAFLGAGVVALSHHTRGERASVVLARQGAWLDRPALLAAPLVMVVVSLTAPQAINASASILSSVTLFGTRLAMVPEGMTRGLQLFRLLALVFLALTFESARAWA